MTPAAEMESPGGAPVSDQPVMVAPASESVAVTVTGVTGEPAGEVWSAGVATVTVLSTVQLKVAVPWASVVSVAVSVTE